MVLSISKVVAPIGDTVQELQRLAFFLEVPMYSEQSTKAIPANHWHDWLITLHDN